MGTALLRRIEREDEAKRQIAWDERGLPYVGRRKWAIDHLLDTGQISPDQHTAAGRLHEVIIVAATPPPMAGLNLGAVHTSWDLTVGAEVRRCRWEVSQSRQIARGARSWVAAAPLTTKPRLRLYDRLFALPLPSWRMIRASDARLKAERISALLDVLAAYWDAMDRGYGGGEQKILRMRA